MKLSELDDFLAETYISLGRGEWNESVLGAKPDYDEAAEAAAMVIQSMLSGGYEASKLNCLDEERRPEIMQGLISMEIELDKMYKKRYEQRKPRRKWRINAVGAALAAAVLLAILLLVLR